MSSGNSHKAFGWSQKLFTMVVLQMMAASFLNIVLSGGENPQIVPTRILCNSHVKWGREHHV